MAGVIDKITVQDIRFPTSVTADGSDAVHPDPDYSVAYVTLHTSDGQIGTGYTFTIGRGTEIVVTAIHALGHHVLGKSLDDIHANWIEFWRSLTQDTQLRWIGPEKGAIHLATAAIVNAVWDLLSRRANKPLWKMIVDMSPEELVSCIDFKYLEDAITPDEALAILKKLEPTKNEREQYLLQNGYPAYTTGAGWLGYSNEKIERLMKEHIERGWTHFKMKVGNALEDDLRRAKLIRELIGSERKLMMDANQRWSVPEAIHAMTALAEVEPWWIEEPTSSDDVLGHAAVAKALAPFNIGVATGEHAQNRVIFKQLMQANAIKFCQVDACRMGGLNEVLSVMLMAAKFGVPVCPHAGGVGLCEYVQHLSIIDYICISGTLENRLTEYANHLEMHYENPAQMNNGRYIPPTESGYGARIRKEAMAEYSFPDGSYWRKQ
jgi:L-fuconate dehydratase